MHSLDPTRNVLPEGRTLGAPPTMGLVKQVPLGRIGRMLPMILNRGREVYEPPRPILCDGENVAHDSPVSEKCMSSLGPTRNVLPEGEL